MSRFAIALLIAGALLRLLFAFSTIQMVYPDEHFQTLEPASLLVNGYGWKSWEWYHGARSWLGPAFFVPPLVLAKGLGILGGALPILFCRAWIALWSSLALVSFALLLKRRFGKSLAFHAGLLGASLSAGMIFWSATTFTETLCLVFYWGLLPWVLQLLLEGKRFSRVFLSGALFAVPMLFRLQAGAFLPGWLIGMLILPQLRKRIPAFLLGYLAVFCLSGLLDALTWGMPFKSTYQNLYINLVKGLAAQHGTTPWYDYFPRIGSVLGAYWVGVLILSLGVFSWKFLRASFQTKDQQERNENAQNESRRSFFETQDLLILLSLGSFFLAHLFIGHKETRFILPLIPGIFYAISWLLSALKTPQTSLTSLTSKAMTASVMLFVFLAIGGGAIGYSAYRFTKDELFFSQADLSRLSLKAYETGALFENGEERACVLLVDHYWIWTRGELLFGREIEHIERTGQTLSKEELQRCRVAMMPAWSEARFRSALREYGLSRNWVKEARISSVESAEDSAEDSEGPAQVLYIQKESNHGRSEDRSAFHQSLRKHRRPSQASGTLSTL